MENHSNKLINQIIKTHLIIKNKQFIKGDWKGVLISFINIYKSFLDKMDVFLILDKPLRINFNFRDLIKQGIQKYR